MTTAILRGCGLRLALPVLLFASVSLADPVNTNGGFETGDFTGWNVNVNSDSGGDPGNGKVQVHEEDDIYDPVPRLGPIGGTYFALVSNGAGDVGDDFLPDTGFLTTNAFSVPVQGAVLSFDYDFLTDEPVLYYDDFDGEWYLVPWEDYEDGFGELDYFMISLLQDGEDPVVLVEGDVFDGDITTGAQFDFLDGPYGDAYDFVTFEEPGGAPLFFSFNLGLQSFSMDLVEGIYALEFKVGEDKYDLWIDGGFDSALWVDDVYVNANAPPTPPGVIPEPGSWALFGLGALGGLLVARRRRRRD